MLFVIVNLQYYLLLSDSYLLDLSDAFLVTSDDCFFVPDIVLKLSQSCHIELLFQCQLQTHDLLFDPC